MPPTHSEAAPSVFGTGLLALDVIIPADAERLPTLAAGGTCGNVLAILAYLGWDAYPVARLNGDVPSQQIRADLLRAGVNLQFAEQEPVAPTPIFVQTIRRKPEGDVSHRFSTNCPRCGAWLPSYRAVTVAAATNVLSTLADARDVMPRVFFFDRASRGAILMAEWFAEQGALVVFEPAGQGDPRLFREAVAASHVLKYSADRITSEVRTACEASPELLEIVTLGGSGLRYRTWTSAEWRTLPAVRAPILVDTAGAGDWCTAGLLFSAGARGSGWLRTLEVSALEQAIRFGQALAALACGFEGARGVTSALTREHLLHAATGLLDGQLTPPWPAVALGTELELGDSDPFACVACATAVAVSEGI